MLPRCHLITALGPLDREALSRLLAVVGEGAVGTGRVDADPDPPGAAREIAELVPTS